MIDLGISKMALIGIVALVVVGPEKLPQLARTLGALLGKAQRYVADVKAEVSRSIELEELRKMKESAQAVERDVSNSIHQMGTELDNTWSSARDALQGDEDHTALGMSARADHENSGTPLYVPQYRHPKKKWRLKRGTMPQWYKVRHGVQTHVQSGAARVARHRPKRQF